MMPNTNTRPLSFAELRAEHGRRLGAALSSGPWTEPAVRLGRELLDDPHADAVQASLAAADHFASPSKTGAMWDSTWEIDSLSDGTPRWSNAIRFTSRCGLGLEHSWRLRDFALDLAHPETVLDFGAGTGASILPWLDVVADLVAIEPALHFRTMGQAIVPEATWAASAHYAPGIEGGCVAIVLAHVLNVNALAETDLEALVDHAAGAEELLILSASNSIRSSRIARNERVLEAALHRRGFDWHIPRLATTLPAGWGEHRLEATRWVRS